MTASGAGEVRDQWAAFPLYLHHIFRVQGEVRHRLNGQVEGHIQGHSHSQLKGNQQSPILVTPA